MIIKIKKIIVTTIVLGLVLNTASMVIGGEETLEALSDADESILKTYNNNFDSICKKTCDVATGFNDLLDDELEFVPGEFIIKFRKEVDIHQPLSQDRVLTTGIKSVDTLNHEHNVISAKKIFLDDSVPYLSNVYKFVLSNDASIPNLVENFKRDSNVVYAEPNYVYHTCVVPDDPDFDLQWALQNNGHNSWFPDADIDAPEAWDIETGDSDVVIAVADTGVDYNHEDLADNIWINDDEILDGKDTDGNGFIDDIRGWDFYENDNDPMDYYGHGTHCAGIASAVTNNGKGIAGVCWNCKIMPVKICSQHVPSDTAANGIIYATDNDADIISMSWGGYSTSQLITDAINYAYSQGVVLVAAAGNENTNLMHFPSAYNNVIAVAATNADDYKAYFSNFGDWVDVAAPGVNIYSTIPDNSYTSLSGTSMSCPHVAGLAGLVLSKNQSLSPEMVRTIINHTADKLCPNENIGKGRINTYEALQHGPGPAIAIIDSPIHDADVEGIIDICGTALGEGFQYFTVEYAKGRCPNSDNWIKLTNSSTSIEDDILASLDTIKLELDEGLYNLRLTVTCSNGIYKDKISLVINNEINTIYVDDEGYYGMDYTSIREAAYNAGNGDTIYVYKGTYYERIKIWKSINLTGENNDGSIIDGNKKGHVVQILADGVNISFFTIQNSAYQHTNAGIYIYSDYNEVTGIILPGHTYAIILDDSSDNKIRENTIIDNVWGIVLKNSSNNIILYDILTKNNRAISLDNSCNTNTITSSSLTDSSISAILVKCSSDNIISDNILTNQTVGIVLSESSNSNIFDNTIKNSDEYGIELSRSNNNIISNNNIENNGIGINLYISIKNKISRNNFITNKEKDAFFQGEKISHCKNTWNENYWNRFRIFPKLILGEFEKWFTKIPWFNLDWHPVKTPYEIS